MASIGSRGRRGKSKKGTINPAGIRRGSGGEGRLSKTGTVSRPTKSRPASMPSSTGEPRLSKTGTVSRPTKSRPASMATAITPSTKTAAPTASIEPVGGPTIANLGSTSSKKNGPAWKPAKPASGNYGKLVSAAAKTRNASRKSSR